MSDGNDSEVLSADARRRMRQEWIVMFDSYGEGRHSQLEVLTLATWSFVKLPLPCDLSLTRVTDRRRFGDADGDSRSLHANRCKLILSNISSCFTATTCLPKSLILPTSRYSRSSLGPSRHDVGRGLG